MIYRWWSYDYEIEILTEVISQLSLSLWYYLSDEDLKITHNSESIFKIDLLIKIKQHKYRIQDQKNKSITNMMMRIDE